MFVTLRHADRNRSDVRAIADVCHDNHVPLVVDEAHGAHLGLLPSLPRSAMQQGADLAVQSTHKVRECICPGNAHWGLRGSFCLSC